MTAPMLAWGETNLYRLPSGQHVWGREFDLLPAGTMFAASSTLHGLIGIYAKPLSKTHCQIEPGAQMVIVGLDGTETRELEGYREDVLEGYRLRELQDAQG